jgi:hypothetical protein
LLDDRPFDKTSGHLSYQCAIQAWGVNNPTTDALVYLQEDAYVNRIFFERWLNSSTCVSLTSWEGKLPRNLDAWKNETWPWATYPAEQLAMKHFVDLVTLRKDVIKCVGHDFTADDFVFSLSEVVAMRTTCRKTKPELQLATLQAAEDSNLWLELAWPMSVKCAYTEKDIFRYKLYTRWDAQGNNLSATWDQYMLHAHDVYHPVKISNGLMFRLIMRDDGWSQVGEVKRRTMGQPE